MSVVSVVSEECVSVVRVSGVQALTRTAGSTLGVRELVQAILGRHADQQLPPLLLDVHHVPQLHLAWDGARRTHLSLLLAIRALRPPNEDAREVG